MELLFRLERVDSYPEAVIGELVLGDERLCFTQELRLRRPRDGVFVPGESAPPAGRYRVTNEPSVQFGKVLPMLWHVQHDFAFYVHPGRPLETLGRETRGCLVLGHDRHVSQVGRTQPAFLQFAARVDFALSKGDFVYIDIRDPPRGKP